MTSESVGEASCTLDASPHFPSCNTTSAVTPRQSTSYRNNFFISFNIKRKLSKMYRVISTFTKKTSLKERCDVTRDNFM